MHAFAVCLLVVTSLLSVQVQPAAGSPPEQGPTPGLLDRYGDPLPEGAVARVGSVRLRHAQLKAFTLVPDGRTAVTFGHAAVLERVGSREARQLLEELANGAAQALESNEAKATLARMTSAQTKP